MLNFKEKLLAFAIVFLFLFTIGYAVFASYTLNPFTRKLDYYESASSSAMTALPSTQIYVGNTSNEATATSSLVVLGNGNVGIGTTSPSQELTVDGNLYLTGNITNGTWIGSVIDSTYIQDAYVKNTGDSMTGNLEITTALNPQLSIKATGVAQQAHLYLEDSDTGTAWQIGAMTNGRLRFVRNATVQTYFTNTGGAVMNVNQNDADFQMNWDSGASFFSEGSNGYIGIGTTTPAYELDVYGNSRIDGTLDITGLTTTQNASTTQLTVTGNIYAGIIQTGTWNGTAIGVAYGGTGKTSYTPGSMLYASSPTTLTEIASSTDGYILALDSNGIPTWVSTSTPGYIEESTTASNGLEVSGVNVQPATGFEMLPSASTTPLKFDDPSFFATSSMIYFTGTTTIPLGASINNEKWELGICYTTVGTARIRCGDGTTFSSLFDLTTSTSTPAFNYTFQFGDKRQCQIGSVSSASTGVSCTIKQVWQ